MHMFSEMHLDIQSQSKNKLQRGKYKVKGKSDQTTKRSFLFCFFFKTQNPNEQTDQGLWTE